MFRLFGVVLILVLLPQQLLAANDAKIDIHKIHSDTYELVSRELINFEEFEQWKRCNWIKPNPTWIPAGIMSPIQINGPELFDGITIEVAGGPFTAQINGVEVANHPFNVARALLYRTVRQMAVICDPNGFETDYSINWDISSNAWRQLGQIIDEFKQVHQNSWIALKFEYIKARPSTPTEVRQIYELVDTFRTGYSETDIIFWGQGLIKDKGYDIQVDGDFGPASCSFLKKALKKPDNYKCGTTFRASEIVSLIFDEGSGEKFVKPNTAVERLATQIQQAKNTHIPADYQRVKSHVEKCWDPPLNIVQQGLDHIVEIEIQTASDGFVTVAKVVDANRFRNDQTFKTSAEAAIRAIRECSPLPINSHDKWGHFIMVFDPRYLSKGTTIGDSQANQKTNTFEENVDLGRRDFFIAQPNSINRNNAINCGAYGKYKNLVEGCVPDDTIPSVNVDPSASQIASSEPDQSDTPSSAELLAAQRKAQELEQQLAAIKAQQEQQQQTISNDTKIPLITIASANTKGKQGVIRGRASDNVGVAEITASGQPIPFDATGNFQYQTFVPTGGKDIVIEVTDVAGLTSKQTVSLTRSAGTATAAITFASLNPLGRRVATNKDALALIIGVDGYENTPARAIYADSDAQMFADYATEKLGIPANRIKTLVNDSADFGDVLLSVREWLGRSVRQNKTDVHVFFAGHGLASENGEEMYLLPYDGRPRLLNETAISRERLFADISAANPRSVTVFLDTCYSGTTRGTDMLIASRPIAIRALEQSIPDNFTVMTAAAGDQTAKPLIEAKHGMFSYFLMKGMEGEADANNDNEITAGELHSYVQTNVIQQSSGSQTPELQGDANRVLVRFQ